MLKERIETPILPPSIRPPKRREGPERRTIILPDILRVESAYDLYDHENNWITTIYQFMSKIIGESIFDPQAQWWSAHTSTRAYRNWLECYEYDIPPHISFGGCIVPGKGDPTFKKRWEAYARKTFC